MKRILLVCFVLGLLVLAGCAARPAATAGSIQVLDPWLRPAKIGDSTGAFMVIKNTGNQPDKLIKAECMASMMTAIHETKKDGDMMTMSEIPALEIPANGQVELKPGSYHVMMMNVSQDLNEGGTMKVTLTFETAGAVEIEVPIKK